MPTRFALLAAGLLAVAASGGWLAAGLMKGGSLVSTIDVQAEADLGTAAKGNTSFALDLYARLREGPGNRFFSPYSISTALAMTFAGARGETAREMAGALHYTLPPDRLHPAFHALIDRVNGPAGSGGKTTGDLLATANALWAQRGEGFVPEFLDLTRTQYGAALRELDLRGAPEASSKTINAWVEEQTRDKIKDLISPSDLTRETSLVLTNAIYFKGRWLVPFPESATRLDGVFNAPGGRKVTVPMMSLRRHFAYADGGTFQLLELPYADQGLSMVVLLPKDPEGLPALEKQLDGPNLSKWLGGSSSTEVAVEFPRFTLTESLQLANVLSAMGMSSAFDPSRADFSGMNGRRDLSISAVIHKAFVDVHEKGTEAAAATGVVMVGRAARLPAAEPIRFRADHPFVFLIREKTTGSLLFLGRVLDPKG